MNLDSDKLPLQVIIAEDDPRYRSSLAALIRHAPGMEVCASFAAAEPMLITLDRAQREGKPLLWDLALMDVGLPGLSGIDAARRLKRALPDLRIVMLTVFEDPPTVLEAISAGVDGYLLKGAPPQEILRQIQNLMQDGAALSPRLAATVMQFVRVANSNNVRHRLPRDIGLTPRELDVLKALTEGCSYREAADKLGISLDTVRTHVRGIYSALRVHNVAEAVSFALKNGLV